MDTPRFIYAASCEEVVEEVADYFRQSATYMRARAQAMPRGVARFDLEAQERYARKMADMWAAMKVLER
jgi:hypothetical protein